MRFLRDRFSQTSADHQFISWILLRLVALGAFVTLAPLTNKIMALIGSNGIYPICNLQTEIYSYQGLAGIVMHPTLSWLYCSDVVIHVILYVAVILSFLMLIGWDAGWILFTIWICFLSLSTMNGIFLSEMWDVFLLEVMFLSLFLVNWTWRPVFLTKPPPPPYFVSIGFIWIAFKTMLGMGLIKFFPMGELWSSSIAVKLFYKNVIAPTVVSWGLYQLPRWVDVFFTYATFVLEMIAPFLIFFGRKGRVVVFFLFVLFQVFLFCIVSFSSLHIIYSAICLYLLFDRDLQFVQKKLSHIKEALQPLTDSSVMRRNIAAVAVILCGIPVLAMHYDVQKVVFVSPRFVYKRQKANDPMLWYLQFLYKYRISSIVSRFRYLPLNGKFVIIEGSYDGETWERIRLKDYLDDEKETPMWITPGMNVVAKQLYFSSHIIDEGANNNMVSHYADHWLHPLKKRLLAGTPEVYQLFEPTPFAKIPPTQIRYRLATFNFTNIDEWRETGQWLRVENTNPYTIPRRNWSF